MEFGMEPKLLTTVEQTIKKTTGFEIVDQKTADTAQLMRDAIKERKSAVEAHYKPLVDAANKAHKVLTGARKNSLLPLKIAYDELGAKLGAYDQEQRKIAAEIERKRQQEEARLRKEAEAAAEKIRLAEQKRLEDEQLAAAEAAEASGDEDLAEAILDQKVEATAPLPFYVPPPAPAEPVYARPEGMKTRTTWKAEVVDFRALCVAIAAGTVPADVISINQSVLNQKARALQNNLNWPGVRTFPETTTI